MLTRITGSLPSSNKGYQKNFVKQPLLTASLNVRQIDARGKRQTLLQKSKTTLFFDYIFLCCLQNF